MVEATTVVRSLHILFAILWAGGGIHFLVITRPALEPRQHLAYVAHSPHGPYMGITSLATVGFGLAAYLLIGPGSYGSAQNAILGTGMAAAILAVIVGFGGHIPNALRAKQALAAGFDAELEPIIKQGAVLDKLSLATVVIALLSMVFFRWF